MGAWYHNGRNTNSLGKGSAILMNTATMLQDLETAASLANKCKWCKEDLPLLTDEDVTGIVNQQLEFFTMINKMKEDVLKLMPFFGSVRTASTAFVDTIYQDREARMTKEATKDKVTVTEFVQPPAPSSGEAPPPEKKSKKLGCVDALSLYSRGGLAGESWRAKVPDEMDYDECFKVANETVVAAEFPKDLFSYLVDKVDALLRDYDKHVLLFKAVKGTPTTQMQPAWVEVARGVVPHAMATRFETLVFSAVATYEDNPLSLRNFAFGVKDDYADYKALVHPSVWAKCESWAVKRRRVKGPQLGGASNT